MHTQLNTSGVNSSPLEFTFSLPPQTESSFPVSEQGEVSAGLRSVMKKQIEELIAENQQLSQRLEEKNRQLKSEGKKRVLEEEGEEKEEPTAKRRKISPEPSHNIFSFLNVEENPLLPLIPRLTESLLPDTYVKILVPIVEGEQETSFWVSNRGLKAISDVYKNYFNLPGWKEEPLRWSEGMGDYYYHQEAILHILLFACKEGKDIPLREYESLSSHLARFQGEEKFKILGDILRLSYRYNMEALVNECINFIREEQNWEQNHQQVADYLVFFLNHLPIELFESLQLEEFLINFCSSNLRVAQQILVVLPELFRQGISELPLEQQRAKETIIKRCLEKMILKFGPLKTGSLNREKFCEVLLIFYPNLIFPDYLYRILGRFKLVASFSSNKSYKSLFEPLLKSGELACLTIARYLAIQNGYTTFNKNIYEKLAANKNYRDFAHIIQAFKPRINSLESIKELECVKGRYQGIAETWKGWFLAREGKFQEAVDLLTQVIQDFPDHALALTFRGEAYRGLGEREKAIEDLNQALKIPHPNNHLTRLYRAKYWYKQGNIKKADEDFKNQKESVLRFADALADYYDCIYQGAESQLLSNPFAHPDKLSQIGSHFSRLPKNAEKIWDQLLKKEKDNSRKAFYLSRKGAYYLLHEDFSSALNYLNQALKFNPKDIFSLARRGLCLILQGQGEEALLDFNQALTLDPEDLFSRCIRGQYFFIQGKIDEALKDFQAVLEKDPSHILALLRQIDILAIQRKEEALDEALKVKNPAILIYQAQHLCDGKKSEEAKRVADDYFMFEFKDNEQLLIAGFSRMLEIWYTCASRQESEALLKTTNDGRASNGWKRGLDEKKIKILLEKGDFQTIDRMIHLDQPIRQPLTPLSYLKLRTWMRMKRWKDVGKGLEIYHKEYSSTKFQHFLYGPLSNRDFLLDLKSEYYFENKKYDQAEEGCLSCLQFTPRFSPARGKVLKNLAFCYYYSQKLDLAYQYIKKILELNPQQQPDCRWLLSKIAQEYTQVKNWDRAIECFLLCSKGNLLNLNKLDLCSLIECHNGKEDFEQALKCIKIALGKFPNDPSLKQKEQEYYLRSEKILKEIEDLIGPEDEDNDGSNGDLELNF